MSTKPLILIVDDSTTIRVSFRKLLKPLGAEIFEAEDGQAALDLALTHSFDVIVSDVDMPNKNGIELCNDLRSSPSTKGIPIVIVSSFDSDADIETGFSAGASAYISKDDAKKKLHGIVEGFLSKASFRAERLVMIVDDSSAICKIVSQGLEQAGFQVITAENGKKALKSLERHNPDLILSDIEMPEMDGFAFCEAVHSDPTMASIPFVVMSVRSEVGDMNRMLQLGAAAYISKPFNIDELVILIERILSDQFLLLLKERERLDVERKLIIASITSLASALEARDAYTRGHSESVTEIVSGMLAFSGAAQQDIEDATIGSRLHDIGKIGIRDQVLLKQGPLTTEEFDHIKLHPTIGAEILQSIPSLSKPMDIVLHHHERFDGKGYPHGLKGKEIPIWARIAAVADTYDALTSDRPYRRGRTQQDAFLIIQGVKGSQLCPECVDLFMKWIETNGSDT